MSHVVSSTAPQASAHTVKLYEGFGINGADIPTTGDNGGSPVLNDGIFSTSEYHWRIETAPSSGVVTIYPDMSYEHTGAADGSWTWVYRLYEDGVSVGTATVTDVFGTAAVVLAIADAIHGHVADNLTLSTQTALSVLEALHAHSADSLGLSTTGSTSLSVAESSHAHTADNIALATQRLLAIADALHAHAADNEVLDTSSAVWLTVQEALHAHASDSLGLSLQTWLVIADAVQAHFADATVLGVDSGGFSGSLSDADIARIAAAVLALAQVTPIHSDVRKVNGDLLAGHGVPPTYDNTGTMTAPGDPWRPA